MKNRKISICSSILMLLLLLPTSIFAQQTDTDRTINCIKEKVANFFVEIDRIESANERKNSIAIIEISNNKVLGYNEKGIYRILDFSTHKVNFLMLKKGVQSKIVTFYDFNMGIKQVVDFLSYNFTEEEQINYLKLVLKELEKNNSLKRNDDLIPREQKWESCR